MQFIEGARHWWRLHSNKLALMAGSVAFWAAAYPQDALKLAELLPDPVRPFAAFLVIGVLPIVVRMMKQGKPDA